MVSVLRELPFMFCAATAAMIASLAVPASGGDLGSTDSGWVRMEEFNGPVRQGSGCDYDPDRNRIVLFSGNDETYSLSDQTWEFDGSVWSVVATGGPAIRGNAVMCYDRARNEMILYGGWTPPDWYLDDTWSWNGTSWTQKEAQGPPARANCAYAYDEARQKIVVFGGSLWQTIYGETWEWDGQEWLLKSAEGPSPRIFPRMAYDSHRGKCVLFGGQDHYAGTTMGDTWEWDGSTWTQVSSTGPDPRLWQMMTFDPARMKTVMFGGTNAFDPADIFGILGDTWELDGNTWTQVSTTGPNPRCAGFMFFDDSLGRVVLYGGVNDPLNHFGGQVFGDFWIYPDEIIESPCGDANGSGGDPAVDIDDVVFLINYVFAGGSAPDPLQTGDADCAGDPAIDIDDIVYLINYIFSGGPVPCDPNGDGTPDCR